MTEARSANLWNYEITNLRRERIRIVEGVWLMRLCLFVVMRAATVSGQTEEVI